MNPWIAKAVVLAASVVMVVIRAPYGSRSRRVKVVTDRKGRLEVVLLILAMFGFLIPLIWNWVAGPSYLVTFGILYACRVRAEERMMLETFGSDYATYVGRTRRLVPGVW